MWRRTVTRRMTVRRTTRPQMEAVGDLQQLLLPPRSQTRVLASRLCFWAPTNHGSTIRAACFFQHVSATTWLRAS
jgi:hypothetical protein